MKQYLINRLEQSDFGSIITLLDYKTQISRCLKSIRMFPNGAEKLLIDTLLCSGMNEYRFIETTLNEDGTIKLTTPISNGGLILTPPGYFSGSAKGGVSQYHFYW